MTRPTHTYATLEISERAYNEIRDKLQRFGSADQIMHQAGREVLDMHGLALVTSPRMQETTDGKKV